MMNNEDNMNAKQSQERFQQEISVIWGLNNYAKIINLIGYSNNPQCIVTKLYQTDLNKFLHVNKTAIPEAVRINILTDIAEGIMAMHHDIGVVHRDLKSPDILLETRNHLGALTVTAVIADFGSARRNIAQTQNYNITTLHGLTPRYTAPEVFSRIKASTTNVSFDLETKADIYSYGVIIWEVFTRKKPWLNCTTALEVETNVLQGKREEIPVLHYGLDSLIQKCWLQNPDERPNAKIIFSSLIIINS